MNQANLVFAIITDVELDLQSAPWIKRFAKFGSATCQNPLALITLLSPYLLSFYRHRQATGRTLKNGSKWYVVNV